MKRTEDRKTLDEKTTKLFMDANVQPLYTPLRESSSMPLRFCDPSILRRPQKKDVQLGIFMNSTCN